MPEARERQYPGLNTQSDVYRLNVGRRRDTSFCVQLVRQTSRMNGRQRGNEDETTHGVAPETDGTMSWLLNFHQEFSPSPLFTSCIPAKSESFKSGRGTETDAVW
jgi:hypothetical protein